MIALRLLSSLEKVFKNSAPPGAGHKCFSCLKNEALSFQAAFCSDCDTAVKMRLSGLPAEKVRIYTVADVPVGLAAFEDSDDYYIGKSPGEYPDVLIPGDTVDASAGKWYSFWIEISGCPDAGVHQLEIDAGCVKQTVTVNVINAELPKQKLVYTNWFHCDAICDYYGVEPFGDEFWQIFRSFAGTAADHGMNCILTPLFTPALDTAVGGERTTTQLVGVEKHGDTYKFDFSLVKKWVEICRSLGIEYFEMSHFFTQWGAEHAPKIMVRDSDGELKRMFGWETETRSSEYNGFLTDFAAEFKKFIYENGFENNVFFHISDEPGEDKIETYLYRAELVKKLFGEFKFIDALSDYEFFSRGAVDIPVPCENRIEYFYGRAKPLWTYYCCGQGREYVPNRFIAMPSERNRIIGLLLYKYDLDGFLQWGYNFYNTQLSLERINPYEVTDAGGNFPAGDAFVVYPGKDGEAVCSLRLKVFREALQDMRALDLLEKLTDRETALGIIGDITFKEYPHNPEFLFETREKINSEIAKNSRNDS